MLRLRDFCAHSLLEEVDRTGGGAASCFVCQRSFHRCNGITAVGEELPAMSKYGILITPRILAAPRSACAGANTWSASITTSVLASWSDGSWRWKWQ